MTLQEKFQKAIDSTNEVLNRWRRFNKTQIIAHDDLQSLFLTKLKIACNDYSLFMRLRWRGKPIAYNYSERHKCDWRIAYVYSDDPEVNSTFAQCDYNKPYDNFDPVIEAVEQINFKTITDIKFE